jgi:glycine/D-amino acid oxidase-like deaminating enzyme
VTGVKVTGFRKDGSGAVKTVITDKGNIDCEAVIVGAGPWVKQIWDMLELPAAITIKGRDGKLHENVPMWTFWSLQEGTLGVDPKLQRTNDGRMPPVIHVDTDATLYSDVDHAVITDRLWGIYYKPDFHFGGVQGGAMPFKVKADPATVKIDPYGPESPDFVVGEDFARMWCSALAFCQKRFEGKLPQFKREPSGGIGSFTADNFPVFDRFCDNVYVIADSNHGYKMIGVGQLVAGEICGERSELLEPFRFSRFAEGRLHPTSNSPFPWS